MNIHHLICSLLKKFNRNIKTYSSRLKSEIEMASKNIETAKEQINYCENILLG